MGIVLRDTVETEALVGTILPWSTLVFRGVNRTIAAYQHVVVIQRFSPSQLQTGLRDFRVISPPLS